MSGTGADATAGTAGRLRALATVAVVTVVVLAQAGLVLAPSQLADHPVLVLALRPTPAFLVLTAGAVAPAVAIVVAALGRTLVDLAYFAVARHGALPVARRLGITRGLTRGLSRPATGRTLMTVTFFWSSTPVIAALGLGRTSGRAFLAVTGLGNLATSTVYVVAGNRLSASLAPLTAWVSTHGAQLTAALAVAVAFGGLVAWRRRGSFGAGEGV